MMFYFEEYNTPEIRKIKDYPNVDNIIINT